MSTARKQQIADSNVFDYFVQKLDAGDLYMDSTLKELDVLSECGRDCVAAIDAAAIFLKHVEMAFGRGSRQSHAVKQTCASTVECFWRG